MSGEQCTPVATVTVYRARHPSVPVYIRIAEEIREVWQEDPAAQEQLYREQAQTLAEALYGALPGGTVDQLLIALLTRRASRLVVALAPTAKPST